MRVGIGRDIHRLAAGHRLVVGGVTLDSPVGAVAHSDGDVLLHAIIDAMLGAAGLGDIGDHFSDTDPRHKGANSRGLLRQAAALIGKQGFRVTQIDATVMLERPKLGPAKRTMCETIAAELGLAPEQVNVKAKTNEGLGEIGRGEAIGAEAVAIVVEDV